MNIRSINPSMGNISCQPIKGLSFSSYPSYRPFDTDDGDIFTPMDPYTQEQKLDLACRIAAYYQDKYEKLLQKTGCCV